MANLFGRKFSNIDTFSFNKFSTSCSLDREIDFERKGILTKRTIVAPIRLYTDLFLMASDIQNKPL